MRPTGILGIALWLAWASLAAAGDLVPDGEVEHALEARIRTVAAESLGMELRSEAPLREAARDFSWMLSNGLDLEAHEFLRQAHSRRGVLDPFPYVVYGEAPRGREGALAARVLAHLRSLPSRERRLTTHVAVGVVERRRWRFLFQEKTLFVTLVVSQRSLSFSPIPETLAPGERFLFEGEVHPPFRRPEILLTRPDGRVAHLDDLSLDAGSFRTWVALDAGHGEYQIEVVARDDMGPRVLGLSSVYARGTGEPTAHERIVAAARAGTLAPNPQAAAPPPPRSVADSEHRMLELLNRDRSRAGLAPLVADAALAAMAREHSRDMRDHDFFAHVSPRTGRLAERAATANIPYRRLAENIAVHRDVEAAQAALLRSPGHRVHILDPQFERVGIGVAIGTDAGGARRVYVTQNFMVP